MSNHTREKKIIAVDGPAGSGKSSVCMQACEKMGWLYLNTGALYRTVAYLAREKQLPLLESDFNQPELLDQIVEDMVQNFKWDLDSNRMMYNNADLTAALNSESIGNWASAVAKYSNVRKKLVPVQREIIFSTQKTVLVDGRDIGTVIVPDADVKIFMTANIKARAKRRLKQLAAAGKINGDESEELEKIQNKLEKRDDQDSTRGTAPLIQADDAILFDTSDYTQPQAVDKLIDLVSEKIS